MSKHEFQTAKPLCPRRGWFPFGWLPAACAVVVLARSPPAEAIYWDYPQVDTCEWPTTVFIEMTFDEATAELLGGDSSSCTGIYVGDHIVLTAAHCVSGTSDVTVKFGEDHEGPVYTQSGVDCLEYPGGQWFEGVTEGSYSWSGPDFAYCELDSGHPEPPRIPVMPPTGCEVSYIRHELFVELDRPVTYADVESVPGSLVGMGLETDDIDGPVGHKRRAPGDILYEDYTSQRAGLMIYVLQPDPIAINGGDSGGPLYFEMPNGSWRVIGVTSFRGNRAFEEGGVSMPVAGYSPVPRFVRWVETRKPGIDITPCYSWNDTDSLYEFKDDPACDDEYDVAPDGGNGSWTPFNTACRGDILSGGGGSGDIDECQGWDPPITIPPVVTAPAASEGAAWVAHAITGPLSPSTVPQSFAGSQVRRHIVASNDDDVVLATCEDEQIVLGRGADVALAGAGDDDVNGGPGADILLGGGGADVLWPGTGADVVLAGPGDDTVVINGDCELEAGEVLLGGAGEDTLIAPFGPLELLFRGVVVAGFEHVETTHAVTQERTCVDPGIELVWGGPVKWATCEE